MIRTVMVAALFLPVSVVVCVEPAFCQADNQDSAAARWQHSVNPLGQSLAWLSTQRVQTALKLAPPQKEQIEKIRQEQSGKIRDMLKQLRDVKQADRARRYYEMQKDLAEAAEAKLQQVLTPKQQTRLKQILWQMQFRFPVYGMQVLTSGEVADALKVTAEQEGKLREAQVKAQQEYRRRVQEFCSQLQEELREKVLGELTAEQRKKLDDLLGEKYEP
jgi:hypothetical protein